MAEYLPDSCPDGAIRHGPADVYGKCPWCNQQIQRPLPAPRRYPRSELSEAYAEHYNPDDPELGPVEFRRLMTSGQQYY